MILLLADSLLLIAITSGLGLLVIALLEMIFRVNIQGDPLEYFLQAWSCPPFILM